MTQSPNVFRGSGQLTGVFTGTADNNEYRGGLIFVGEELELDETITGSVAFELNIRSLEGNDAANVDVFITGTAAAEVDLFGMKHVDIDSGADNDLVCVNSIIAGSPNTLGDDDVVSVVVDAFEFNAIGL